MLTASGDAAFYSWDLGDGTAATGARVTHVYPAGRFLATVTATSSTGETAQAQVEVVATRQEVRLDAPAVGDYGAAATLTGIVRPARRTAVRIYRSGTYVTTAAVRPGGRFRTRILMRRPGAYEARVGDVRSGAHAIRVRPRLLTALRHTATLGDRLVLSAHVVPALAGKVRVVVRRDGRIVSSRRASGLRLRLSTSRATNLRISLTVRPRPGYLPVKRRLSTRVVLPSLALGDRGPSVIALERRLAQLRYALRAVDTVFATDTFEAVLAFQKVHRLARTGRVDAALWRRLARASIPRARHGAGNRIEVDKTRQVLFEITNGRVSRTVHVSTGLTGNTPLGRWQVYRKVTGFDWVLWYPLYFLRGFAIHGYPSVPAYPASHGCVRVPMWIAPSLFTRHGFGATIVVYA